MPLLFTDTHKERKGIDISLFTLEKRANLWILRGCVGRSSSRIWGHMTGTICEGDTSNYPLDVSDFNRCLLLLEAVPEWESRIREMSAHGPVWALIAEHWQELKVMFLSEAGLNFSISMSAPRTGALLKSIFAKEKSNRNGSSL